MIIRHGHLTVVSSVVDHVSLKYPPWQEVRLLGVPGTWCLTRQGGPSIRNLRTGEALVRVADSQFLPGYWARYTGPMVGAL